MKSILILFTLAIVLFLVCASGCSSAAIDGEDAPASVEQPVPQCNAPAFFHKFTTIASTTTTTPSRCGTGSPVYGDVEPHAWSIDLNGPAPKRTDGRCSCRWVNTPLCTNYTTGEQSMAACVNGACSVMRSFDCWYGNNCASRVQYAFEAYTYNGSWNNPQLTMRTSDSAGCQRLMIINSFPVYIATVPL